MGHHLDNSIAIILVVQNPSLMNLRAAFMLLPMINGNPKSVFG